MTNERITGERKLSNEDKSFLEQTINKAESEMRQGYLRFSNQKIVYFNPVTRAFVLLGRVGPKITYIYGVENKMEGHMTWPDRYSVSFRGVEETEDELRIKLEGEYEGYGGFMYKAKDLVLEK